MTGGAPTSSARRRGGRRGRPGAGVGPRRERPCRRPGRARWRGGRWRGEGMGQCGRHPHRMSGAVQRRDGQDAAAHAEEGRHRADRNAERGGQGMGHLAGLSGSPASALSARAQEAGAQEQIDDGEGDVPDEAPVGLTGRTGPSCSSAPTTRPAMSSAGTSTGARSSSTAPPASWSSTPRRARGPSAGAGRADPAHHPAPGPHAPDERAVSWRSSCRRSPRSPRSRSRWRFRPPRPRGDLPRVPGRPEVSGRLGHASPAALTAAFTRAFGIRFTTSHAGGRTGGSGRP